MDSCEFCVEFKNKLCPSLSPPSDRFIFENEDFVVFPALGSFVEGYLLVCSRAHRPSFASLSQAQLRSLEDFMDFTCGIVESAYERPIVFEHGLASCHKRAGGCIDHAHFHVVPRCVDINQVLLRDFSSELLTNWSEIGAWQGRPYLLTRNVDGPIVICEVPENLPSQFLRKRVARYLNIEERWDWGAYLGLTEIGGTISRLRDSFKSQVSS